MRTFLVKTAGKLTNGFGEKGEKDWLKVTGRLRCRFLVFILCVNTCAMEVRVLWEGMQLWADGRNLEKVLQPRICNHSLIVIRRSHYSQYFVKK